MEGFEEKDAGRSTGWQLRLAMCWYRRRVEYQLSQI
jgi:hypothetical protein